jgi:hypothetical protein
MVAGALRHAGGAHFTALMARQPCRKSLPVGMEVILQGGHP